ncbi:MAG: hypothetical protein PHS41_01190 [Victivallaceae bacterium]|nr:hypothetical protein [Victivallaceae bacterium]
MSAANVTSKTATAILNSWLDRLDQSLTTPAEAPNVQYYGTGESTHWAIQSNWNVVGALTARGVLQKDPRSIHTALAIFRYLLGTHRTGDLVATDGKQWQNHWISVLGIERAACCLKLLTPFMTAEDQLRFKNLQLDMAEWLLDEYDVAAGLDGLSGRNRPESNLWNGAFLHRMCLDYPDHPRCHEFRKKGTKLLLNGISLEQDASSLSRFDGIALQEWHVGANFTENYSLDHHAYMNIGYSFICLSHVAFTHYYFKLSGAQAPEALYLHAKELWQTVKNFVFADGRLLRIGGDTRARYTYCQVYALVVFLFAGDYWQDEEARSMQSGLLAILDKEQQINQDGSFYGKRLANIRQQSYYYYTRLESDPAVALANVLTISDRLGISDSGTIGGKQNPPCFWTDDFHAAALLRTGNSIRSFVADGGQGPMALCLAADRSDMAEWQSNFFFNFGLHRNQHHVLRHNILRGKDQFVGTSVTEWSEEEPYGEGEEVYRVIRSYAAVAGLPDGKTLLVCEYVIAIKDATLDFRQTVNWQLPNDCFNGGKRWYRGGNNFTCTTASRPGQSLLIPTHTTLLHVDGTTLESIYGVEQFFIRQRETPAIVGQSMRARKLHSLFTDEICGEYHPSARVKKGACLADTAFCITADTQWEQSIANAGKTQQLPTEGLLRAMLCRGVNRVQYGFAVNFDTVAHKEFNRTLSPGEAILVEISSSELESQAIVHGR